VFEARLVVRSTPGSRRSFRGHESIGRCAVASRERAPAHHTGALSQVGRATRKVGGLKSGHQKLSQNRGSLQPKQSTRSPGRCSLASRTCGSKVGGLNSGHQKLSQNRGSLHQFENRRAEPVGETILIGTLVHNRSLRYKTGHGPSHSGKVRSAISSTERQQP
jgi:hypothetical protein